MGRLSYSVRLNRRSEKIYKALSPRVQDQLKKSLKALMAYLEDIGPMPDIRKLKGKYTDVFRLRSGDYRVLFRLLSEGIEIVEIIDIITRQVGY